MKTDGSVRSGLRSTRRAAVIAVVACLACLLGFGAALAGSAPQERDRRVLATAADDRGPAEAAAPDRQIVDAAIQEQLAREERLKSPDARRARARSRSVFADLAPGDAIELARQTFPGHLRSKLTAGPELQDGARVERYLDERSARIDVPGVGADALAESTLPLRAENEQGEQAPVDLSLQDEGGFLESRNPLVAVRFSKDLTRGVVLEKSGVGVALAGPDPTATGGEEGDRLVAPDALLDTDFWAKPTPAGFQTYALLRSADSPEQIVYDVDVPDGTELRAVKDGAAEVVRVEDGERIASVSAPLAWDADSKALEVQMRVAGSQLVLDVPHRDADFRYPLLVDPEIVEEWDWRLVNSDYDGWQGRSGYGMFDSGYLELPHRWGDGLYVFTRDGANVSTGLAAGFTFDPPGLSTYVHTGYARMHHAPYNSCVALRVVPGALGPATCGPLDDAWGQACGMPCDASSGPVNGATLDMEMWSTTTGVRTSATKAIAAITAAVAYYSDPDSPVLGAVVGLSTTPHWAREWTGSGSGPITDGGVGVRQVAVQVEGTEWVGGVDLECEGTSSDPCLASFPFSAGLSTTDAPLAAVEGRRAIKLRAWDAVGHESVRTLGELRIDRTQPEVNLSGAVWSGRLDNPSGPALAPGSHELKIGATDEALGGGPANERSGVRRIEVRVDGVTVFSTNDVACPASSCSMARAWMLATGDYSAGVHTVAVTVVDHAGNSRTSSFDVKVPPAGELTWPAPGAATSRWIPVQAQADVSGYSTVRFQYRKPNGGWSDMPASTLVRDDGQPVASVDQPLTASLSPRLHWDVTKTLPNFVLDDPRQRLELRARFSGGQGGTSKAVHIVYDQRGLTTDDATSDVGPGAVNLVTGNLAVTAGDASISNWGGQSTLSRTHNSRDPGAEPTGPFGPGWIAGVPVADASNYSSLDVEDVPGYLTWAELRTTQGSSTYFIKNGGQWTPADPADSDLTLTPSGDSFQLASDDGMTVVFARQPGTLAARYVPVEVRKPGGANTATIAYEVMAGKPRPKRIVAPAPAGVSCASPSTRGCRSLTLVYSTSTTANSTSEAGWGSYLDRIERIEMTAWDPATATMATDVVSRYLYDSGGRLRAQWDPRIPSALKERYHYDGSGRLTQVDPASAPAYELAYAQLTGDQDGGRLASASIATPQGLAKTTLVYGVAVAGLNAPRQMGKSDVAAWGQSEVPFTGTAIFPATYVPASMPPASYAGASLHYLNSSGREVNTAGPNGGVASMEYDRYGNVIRELSPANRARALASGGLSAQVANRLDTERTFVAEGLEMTEQLEPEREVTLANGNVVQARRRTVVSYDEGATSGDPHLPTTTKTSAQVAGGPAVADERIAKTEYDWSLRQPTRQILDPNGLAATTSFTYNVAGIPLTTTRPETGTATRTTEVYAAGGSGACAQKPEWAGLPCRTYRAAQSTGLPAPLQTTYTYNRLNQIVREVKENVGSTDQSQIVTESTFDAAGRALTSKTSATDVATGLVAAYGFEEASGTTTADHSGRGNTGTLENGVTRRVEGRFGRALQFDGNDDRVRVADAASLDLSGAMTVQAWVRPDAFLGEVRNVVSRGTAVTGCAAPSYALVSYSSPTSVGPRGGWCNAWTASGPLLKTGLWSHLAVTKQGTTLRTYLNGVQVSTGTASASPSDMVGDLLIGDGAGGQFNGLIDEVRVYSRDLSSSDIAKSMNTPVDEAAAAPPGPRSGLRAGYGFEEAATSTTLTDTSLNGSNGTTTAASRVAGGRHGAGITHGTVPNKSALNVSSGLTVEAWIWQDQVAYGSGGLIAEKAGAYSLRAQPNGTVWFSVTAGGTVKTAIATLDVTAINAARHVAGTWDGSTVRIYVNGIQQPSSQSLTGTIAATTGPLTIGQSGSTRIVDELRLYGSALPAAEIQEDSRTAVRSPLRHAAEQGSGTALPMATIGYDPGTGRATTLSTTEGGVSRTLTTGYDAMGRVTSYTDADGNTSTTSYDLLGRPVTVADGKGTQTFGYDTTTGQLTQLQDSHAGTFTASYDADGKMISRTYPNGMVADTIYDEAGAPTDLTYTKAGCSSNCVWYEEHVQSTVHGQWAQRESTASRQTYGYDALGRLTLVKDDPTGGEGCRTRHYAYDLNSNRTSRKEFLGGGGNCYELPSGEEPTQTSAYDYLDRLTSSGFVYDRWGRTNVVPVSHAGGGDLVTSYYDNDMVRSQSQDGVSKAWLLDPTQTRQRATVPSGDVQEVMHYSDGSDSPAWTKVVDAGNVVSWERPITGIDGSLAAIASNDGSSTTTKLQLVNLHGDVTGTASTSSSATAPLEISDADEFGNPRQAGGARRYGWLGGKERRAVLPSGVVQMGVRSYVPDMGRFTSVDPVVGGSHNDYEYAGQDAMNSFDLDGRLKTNGCDIRFNFVGPAAPSIFPPKPPKPPHVTAYLDKACTRWVDRTIERGTGGRSMIIGELCGRIGGIIPIGFFGHMIEQTCPAMFAGLFGSLAYEAKFAAGTNRCLTLRFDVYKPPHFGASKNKPWCRAKMR